MEHLMICAICGRSFEASANVNTCKNCIEGDMSDFNRIRDYLYVHPKARIFEVSTNLDIPVPKIKRFLKEGRLEIIEKDNAFLKCEKCGKPICSGIQCDDCMKQSAHDYKSALVGNSKKSKTKINYLPSSGKP